MIRNPIRTRVNLETAYLGASFLEIEDIKKPYLTSALKITA